MPSFAERPRSNIDAVLVHVYGYNKQTPGKRPDARGRLQVAAARQLYKLGIDHFVIAGGKMEENLPPLAEVTADELTRKLHLSMGQVTVCPTRNKTGDGEETPVKDTLGEIEVAQQSAKENGWKNLASLANRTHTYRTSMLWKQKGQKTTVLTTESILSSLPNERNAKRYKRILRKLNWSLGEVYFILQEIPKIIISLHPAGARLLQHIAEKSKRKPGMLID